MKLQGDVDVARSREIDQKSEEAFRFFCYIAEVEHDAKGIVHYGLRSVQACKDTEDIEKVLPTPAKASIHKTAAVRVTGPVRKYAAPSRSISVLG